MIQTAIITALTDISAFCAKCPESNEVSETLRDLGFFLVWSMPEIRYARKTGQDLPVLPAQYHYRDRHGTEVIFLAGPDTPCGTEGGKYPRHASRWWLYPGSSQYNYNLVIQELSAKWGLSWLPNTQDSKKS